VEPFRNAGTVSCENSVRAFARPHGNSQRSTSTCQLELASGCWGCCWADGRPCFTLVGLAGEKLWDTEETHVDLDLVSSSRALHRRPVPAEYVIGNVAVIDLHDDPVWRAGPDLGFGTT
jgi:hypothetical protein